MYKSLLTYNKGESVVLRPLYCIIDKNKLYFSYSLFGS